jgi:hypothetical protein
MIRCAHCQRENPEGMLLCIYCGELIGPVGDLLQRKTREIGEHEAIEPPQDWNPDTFDRTKRLLLRVVDSGQIIEVDIHRAGIVVLGRRSPVTGLMADVDLAAYAGYRMGVSRRHAVIRLGDEGQLELRDLGSVNGTFLNGERLRAHQSNYLHNGDEVRLGHLRLQALIVNAAEWERAAAS